MLNSQIVDSSDESEGSVLTPVAAPGVADDPVLGSIFLSPASHADVVVLLHAASLVIENTARVVPELIGDGEGAGDGSALVDLVHHGSFSLDESELIDSVDFGAFLGPAAPVGHAVLALDHGRAFHSVVVAEGLIRRAGLVGDVVVVDPFVGVLGVTAGAAVDMTFAGNEKLR